MINYFKNMKYKNEKKKIILFGIFLLLLLYLAFSLFIKAFSSYQSNARLSANIDKALYIFEGEKLSFNIDPEKIVPSDKPYSYKFTLANFTDSKMSDMDIEYTISIKTTTNLPITLKLYRNELPTDSGAVNLLSSYSNKQDKNNAWYKVYDATPKYTMKYTESVTDTYTLVVDFPKEYAVDTTYAEKLEYINITINSRQVVGE